MTPNIFKSNNTIPVNGANDPNHPRNQDQFKPDSLKQSQEQSDMSGKMDGDHAAKSMDAAANKATNAMDMTDGIHEDAVQNTGAGDKTTGHGTSMLSKDGAIGSQFTSGGNIGAIGEKVGGPFASSGTIGQAFTAQGAVGGTIQKLAEKNEQH